MRNLFILSMLIPLTFSCATAPKPGPMPRQDPLIGKIISAKTKKQVSYDQLLHTIRAYDVVYISEKHDNPVHHNVQKRIIRDLSESGHPPQIGFEFFSVSDTPLLLNFMDSKNARHTPEMENAVQKKMREKLGWTDQTDKMWSFYWSLLTLARDNGLTVAGLDLTTSQKRRITRKGAENLTALETKQIFSTHLNDPVYKAHMTALFKAVHCGMGHGRMAEKLYDTWLARNDRMALSITELHDTKAPNSGPVIVIMGNGHTEYGLGVMDRVAYLNPSISQLNLAMTEINPTPADLDDYLTPLDLKGYSPELPADFLWFTQRVSYEDPCLKFRKVLEHMKTKKRRNAQNQNGL
ncbi:MAG: hypothetical protein CSA29_05095 [Desulfobacterales bacterium]|nr:MAG: hypothetical protein CSA29_05095 [Desulfobacterales bacterium]